MTQFNYEFYETQEEVRKHIQRCEGRHPQSVAYSTFHDAITQVCFGCKTIRSSVCLIRKVMKSTHKTPNLPKANQEKVCPDCMAHYTGQHECDGLMKMLVRKHKPDILTQMFEANGIKFVQESGV